ncbi:MAG: hypothetical protein HOH58_00070 [Opitutaceae bacterium]|jgi:hypothetical protein|nr:hypothetical protein [Opitutaceae bacterium]
MDFPHFVSIEQKGADGELQHFVVHTRDPKMAVRFSAKESAGRLLPGTIQSISVPNSWAGEYDHYAKLVAKAEAFFGATLKGDIAASDRSLRRFE